MSAARPSTTGRWPFVRDVLAFLLGTFILLWQTVARDQADTTLTVAGLVCLGVTGSGLAQRWIEARLPTLPAPPTPPTGDPPA